MKIEELKQKVVDHGIRMDSLVRLVVDGDPYHVEESLCDHKEIDLTEARKIREDVLKEIGFESVAIDGDRYDGADIQAIFKVFGYLVAGTYTYSSWDGPWVDDDFYFVQPKEVTVIEYERVEEVN